jgi:DNA-binding MarR family transcriptional regulator
MNILSEQIKNKTLEGALKNSLPPLTEKQAECLKFVMRYFLDRRYYPTQREVAEAMNLSSSTAESYLKPLILKGYLERGPHRRRNIRLTTAAVDKLELDGMRIREQLVAA